MSRKEIIEKTFGEIRSFLDEISNGTSRYRSLHSLTEQVEHQYHGRFLIELIQNAHDALLEVSVIDEPQRIEIVIAKDEHPHGALYIANDGQLFTSSNFKAISNLGQSDKDPQKGIGNKGIGFRSVLEITKAPEFYSRKERGSEGFDGFCFRFDPRVIQLFEDPIRQIIDGERRDEILENFEESFVKLDDSRYETLRNLCKTFENDWIAKELAFLSPYALPIPMRLDGIKPKIKNFEKRGFSTVIRLPFQSEKITELAKKKMEEMNESTMIFLHRLNKLNLVFENVGKSFYREQKLNEADIAGCFEVKIECAIDNSKANSTVASRYWLWQRKIGGRDKPEEQEKIQDAVIDLPGKWPSVDEATVEIAVQIGEQYKPGLLNIYLPTVVSSGCAAYFSAPFYGDMSRTHIDFDTPYNQILLEAIAEKTVDVILSSLAGKDEAAALIIDLMAPLNNKEGDYWWKNLTEVFSARGIKLENEDIVLSDEGWCSLRITRLLPEIESARVLSESVLRSEATYPIFAEVLSERKTEIERILNKFGISSKASPIDNAATVEAVAKKLASDSSSVDWNGFWSDVRNLFNQDASPLIGRKVLWGTDNQLHACNDKSSVFFRPRVSGTDDEIIAEHSIDYIPENLRPYISFLNAGIQTHIPRAKGGLTTTPVHGYLSSGLVENYGVERIFKGVLLKATPELPTKLSGQDSNLCADILQWSLRLLMASKGRLDEVISDFGKLPAPCMGGWYPIKETSFGPGWPGKSGSELYKYLQQSETVECKAAIKRLLLPPDHHLWCDLGKSSSDDLKIAVNFLERAGAFNGIRLVVVNAKNWSSRFMLVPGKGVKLPENCPPGCSAVMWEEYREFIFKTETPKFTREHKYELMEFYMIPGFEKLGSYDEAVLGVLMRLLLESIYLWETRWKNWERVTIRKIYPRRHKHTPLSPLAFSLKEAAWMQDAVNGEIKRFRPADRWYIPTPALLGGIHQFSHLNPIPNSVASLLNENSELVESIKTLGMPVYDPEAKSADPRLLNDLATAQEDKSIEISNQSVFLGQIRNAWNNFFPDYKNRFPSSLIVRNGKGSLRVITPSEDNIVYLPDAKPAVHDGLQLHSKPVIEMDAKSAKRLQVDFQTAFPVGIRLASELKTKALVDGRKWRENEIGVQLTEELPWIIPVILSVFAFSTQQSRGTETKTFNLAMDNLRQTKITWVDRLEAGLWQADKLVAMSPVSALWKPKFKTLLATKDARSKFSLLSEAFVSIVGRSDIEIHLKLVLGDYERTHELSDEIICSVLQKLRITTDQYQEVQQKWLGELSWRVRLVRPVILLVQSSANISLLDKVASEEQFQNILDSFILSPLNVDKVLSIVAKESGMKSVGLKLWKILGESAQLHRWNEVLNQAGELNVTNDRANEQFQIHLYSGRTILRSLIRWVIRKNQVLEGFMELEAKLSGINCPSRFEKQFWVVEFKHVMKKVLDFINEWRVDPNVINALENSRSIEELRNKFDELGLQPDNDPIEIHANNLKIFSNFLNRIKRVAIAWCIREKVIEGMWGEDNQFFESKLVDEFAKAAFIDTWNEAFCFDAIRKLSQPKAQKELWKAINSVSKVEDLMKHLQISETQMTNAEGQLESRRRQRLIQKKTVSVCGENFVNTRDNYENLFDHILTYTKNDDASIVSLNEQESLKDQKSRRRTAQREEPPKFQNKPKERTNKSMKYLVGLDGEIHAFQALQRAYGTDKLGPSSWISEISRHKYPKNVTNDGFGCDFVICKDDKVYYVEVKATRKDDESFKLESSEIVLAIDCANRRKKKFLILHVLNALESNPIFHMLPNPYDRNSKAKFRFEEAGLRLKYETY